MSEYIWESRIKRMLVEDWDLDILESLVEKLDQAVAEIFTEHAGLVDERNR